MKDTNLAAEEISDLNSLHSSDLNNRVEWHAPTLSRLLLSKTDSAKGVPYNASEGVNCYNTTASSSFTTGSAYCTPTPQYTKKSVVSGVS